MLLDYLVPSDQALNALRRADSDLQPLTGSSEQILAQLRNWAPRTAEDLRMRATASTLDILLWNRPMTAVVLDGGDDPTLVNAALAHVKARLAEQIELLEAFTRNWALGELVGIDTNVFIHDPEFFSDIDWKLKLYGTARPAPYIRLVLPLQVIDELDDLKRSGKQDVRTTANRTVRELAKLFRKDDGPVSLNAAIDVDTSIEVLDDHNGRVRIPNADEEITDRLGRLRLMTGREVHFVAADNGAVTRARRNGLTPHLQIYEH